MNPYTAQVIGGNIGQFLQSRGKDARRERMLRLIQIDNEQKKLASFLEEQKRQQDARDAAAKAAQDKIAQQNQIRDAQEKMRLEVLQWLTPTETVAGPMAAIPGALAALEEAARERAGIPRDGQEGTPDTLDTSQGLGVWSPGEEPMPRPKFMKGPQMGPIIEGQQEFPPMGESPTPLSMIGREEAQAVEKGMDPDMAAFYRSEFQGSRPEDLDTLAREFKKDMFKAAPKTQADQFIREMLSPIIEKDATSPGGKWATARILSTPYELAVPIAKSRGVDLTPEMYDQMVKAAETLNQAGAIDTGEESTQGEGFTLVPWTGKGPPPVPERGKPSSTGPGPLPDLTGGTGKPVVPFYSTGKPGSPQYQKDWVAYQRANAGDMVSDFDKAIDAYNKATNQGNTLATRLEGIKDLKTKYRGILSAEMEAEAVGKEAVLTQRLNKPKGGNLNPARFNEWEKLKKQETDMQYAIREAMDKKKSPEWKNSAAQYRAQYGTEPPEPKVKIGKKRLTIEQAKKEMNYYRRKAETLYKNHQAEIKPYMEPGLNSDDPVDAFLQGPLH